VPSRISNEPFGAGQELAAAEALVTQHEIQVALPLGRKFARVLALDAELEAQRSMPKLPALKRLGELALQSMWELPAVLCPELAAAAGEGPTDVAKWVVQRLIAASQQRGLQGAIRAGGPPSQGGVSLHRGKTEWRGAVAGRAGRSPAASPCRATALQDRSPGATVEYAAP